MTTPEERYQEFMEECVNTTDDRPGATRIDGVPARLREAGIDGSPRASIHRTTETGLFGVPEGRVERW